MRESELKNKIANKLFKTYEERSKLQKLINFKKDKGKQNDEFFDIRCSLLIKNNVLDHFTDETADMIVRSSVAKITQFEKKLLLDSLDESQNELLEFSTQTFSEELPKLKDPLTIIASWPEKNNKVINKLREKRILKTEINDWKEYFFIEKVKDPIEFHKVLNYEKPLLFAFTKKEVVSYWKDYTRTAIPHNLPQDTQNEGISTSPIMFLTIQKSDGIEILFRTTITKPKVLNKSALISFKME